MKKYYTVGDFLTELKKCKPGKNNIVYIASGSEFPMDSLDEATASKHNVVLRVGRGEEAVTVYKLLQFFEKNHVQKDASICFAGSEVTSGGFYSVTKEGLAKDPYILITVDDEIMD